MHQVREEVSLGQLGTLQALSPSEGQEMEMAVEGGLEGREGSGGSKGVSSSRSVTKGGKGVRQQLRGL